MPRGWLRQECTADDSATYGTVTLIVPMVFDSVPTVAETNPGTVMLELLSGLDLLPSAGRAGRSPPSLLLPPLPPPQEPMLIGRSSKQTNKIPVRGVGSKLQDKWKSGQNVTGAMAPFKTDPLPSCHIRLLATTAAGLKMTLTISVPVAMPLAGRLLIVGLNRSRCPRAD